MELHPNSLVDNLILNYIKLHPGVDYNEAKKAILNLLT